MKTTSTKSFVFLGILLALLSCEKVIDIDIPEGERKIVVNGLIHPDSLIKVNVSRSLSVLEENQFVFLETADVRIKKDGIELGQLEYLESGFYYLPDHYPIAGSVYELDVGYPGLASVSSQANLPDPILFSEIDTSSTTDEWMGGVYRLSFSFQDPPDPNYYAISLTATHKVFDYETFTYLDSLTTYPVYFNFIEGSEGPQSAFVEQGASTHYGSKIYFADDLFSDREMSIDIELSKFSFFDADTVELTVSLEHVSQDYYYYAVSSGKYDQSTGNPFAEPVSVFSNIENGIGIFSGYSFFRRNLLLVVDIDR